jgi:hypothetical protein
LKEKNLGFDVNRVPKRVYVESLLYVVLVIYAVYGPPPSETVLTVL